MFLEQSGEAHLLQIVASSKPRDANSIQQFQTAKRELWHWLASPNCRDIDLPSLHCGFSSTQQGIGCLSHGAHHHHGSISKCLSHDSSTSEDLFSSSNRSTTKFHHQQLMWQGLRIQTAGATNKKPRANEPHWRFPSDSVASRASPEWRSSHWSGPPLLVKQLIEPNSW